MKRTITAYEAPALIDAHGAMTRLALYERLTGVPTSPKEAGLASRIATGVVEQASEDFGWKPPVRNDFRMPIEGTALEGHSRAYVTADAEGTFVAVFQHVPAYVHSYGWNKSGVPPHVAVVQAQWAMAMAQATRLAYVVLADKRIVIYWVARDDEMIARLMAAAAEMQRRIDANDPPPIDATPDEGPVAVAPPKEGESVDLDELAGRWRGSQIQRAATQNALQLVEHAYEAATEALKATIPPGGHHDYDGVRIHHHAKNKRLTEEKIDGLYF
jgi:hypothetical protein